MYRKCTFFASSPWKSYNNYRLARMGRNFDDYSGFQLKATFLYYFTHCTVPIGLTNFIQFQVEVCQILNYASWSRRTNQCLNLWPIMELKNPPQLARPKDWPNFWEILWSKIQVYLAVLSFLSKYRWQSLKEMYSSFIIRTRVSVQGVESLWGDCRFIPADWGSQ